eukprot:snap_masked-scaffold417_size177606-processed-gene-0.19 protein:Tk07608 transcript:snap_masked-scaffold417_size177606-processed-gene-0.19-mRNA-1 annotation:"hypothetical protein DAPPUDRAFT_130439"
MNIEDIRTKLAAKDQEHVLAFWDELSPTEQEEFKGQLVNLVENLDEYLEFFERTIVAQDEKCDKVDDLMSPLDENQCGSTTTATAEEKAEYRQLAFNCIANNELGILLLAGGQGTRLGVSYPKGMYNVGMPSGKSLYHLQAERILKLERLAQEATGKRGQITWYIMTSASTRKPTADFFAQNNFFGLKESNVVIFQQGTLPCFTFSGQIIMGGKTTVARAPDGNGGLYRALRNEKILEDMKKRGIKNINLYCVDNILAQVGDPAFVGYCISKNADCANKVVAKSDPHESVGVTCKVNGKHQVVEYSEITKEVAEKTNADGSLAYSAGNICIHFFTREFLENVINEHEPKLVHHMAKKKIPKMDLKTKELEKPAHPNGIKMEKFVFDVFQFAERFVVWECLREEEFAPLKNAEGAKDSTPTYCKNALYARCQKWAMAAGGSFVDKDGNRLPLMISPASPKETNNNNNNNVKEVKKPPADFVAEVEISPLVSFGGEGLEKLVSGKTFQVPCHEIGL